MLLVAGLLAVARVGQGFVVDGGASGGVRLRQARFESLFTLSLEAVPAPAELRPEVLQDGQPAQDHKGDGQHADDDLHGLGAHGSPSVSCRMRGHLSGGRLKTS